MSKRTSSTIRNNTNLVENGEAVAEIVDDAPVNNRHNDVRVEEVIVPVPTASVYTDVTNFLRVIVTNLWIVILVAILGAAGAYLYARSEPEVFRASGKVVVVSPIDTTSSNFRDLLAIYNELNTNILGNYVQILRSRVVTNDAKAKLASEYDPELLDEAEIEITPIQNSSFITIDVLSTDTMLAFDMVNAIIEAAINRTPDSMSQLFPLTVQDPPVEPDDRIAPNVRLIVVFGAAGSAAVGIALAFLFDAYKQYRRNRQRLLKSV